MLVLFALCFSFSLMAQTPFPTDATTKRVSFTETVIVGDTLKKEILYKRSQEWLLRTYPGVKFTLEDAVGLKYIIQGTFKVKLTYDFKYKADHTVNYMVTIIVKDGKYKYTLTEFSMYKASTGAGTSTAIETAYPKMTTQNKSEFTTQVNAEVKRVTDDMKLYMLVGQVKAVDDF